jgi:hypothetical protein
MTLRLRTDFWVAALRRRAEAAGANVAVAKRGADHAGAVYILVDRLDGRFDLYGPAPQSIFAEGPVTERLFQLMAGGKSDEEVQALIERELRFDTDLWLVAIEDRERRHFSELANDDTIVRFTAR